MSSVKHTVQTGDTLRSLSEKYYYNSASGGKIKQANNLSSDTPEVGRTLIITDVTGEKRAPFKFETVGVVIAGKKFEFWQDLSIQFGLDMLAPTFSFSSPYEIEDDFKNAFEPYGFQDIEIYHKGKKMLTGIMSTTAYDRSDSGNSVSVGGYGKAGLLKNVTLPLSLYPRQLIKQSLSQIAKRYCAPFSVFVTNTIEAETATKQLFDKTEIGETEKVGSYLVKLAKERGLIADTNIDGELQFSKDTAKSSSVFEIKPGEQALQVTYNSDSIFSDYSGLFSAKRGKKSEKATTHIAQNANRHTTITKSADDDGSLTDYIQSEVGRSVMASMQISFELPGWLNSNGDIWQPRQVIKIHEPRARIEHPTEFVIKTVALSIDGKKASIEVVPKSALENKFVRFWE
jgi:prophage tail gpP-like protein